MNLLLPQIYNLMMNLIRDPSEQSVLIQKQILKIYCAHTEYAIPSTGGVHKGYLFQLDGNMWTYFGPDQRRIRHTSTKTKICRCLPVLLKILDQYRNKVYASPRMMTHKLNYIKHAVSHAHSMLNPHFIAIIQDVIFPLMCYSELDKELWQTDPIQYIRQKYIHNGIHTK